jgi:hypothetical protein
MKHNLVRIEDYLLVVDESVKKINNGEYYLLGGKHVNMWGGSGYRIMSELTCKIIAHLPLNNASYLDGVPVLPSLNQEDEAEEIFPVGKHGAMHMPNREMINNALRQQAYNKAKEKYKWTDEDVRNIIMHSFLKGVDRGHYSKEIEDRIIQSFQQPKLPIAFECEMRTKQMPEFNEDLPKTIINDEGRTECVGKYIY